MNVVHHGLQVLGPADDEGYIPHGWRKNTLAAKTAPVAISEFVGRYVVNINGMMAGGIIAALPPVILGLLFQRYIVSGMTAGAVKG